MILVTNKSELTQAQKLLKENLLTREHEIRKIYYGFRGGAERPEIKGYYFPELNIWWIYRKLADKATPRHWNSFGISEPHPTNSNSIVVEINFPLEGETHRLGGYIAKEDDRYILLHKGGIGGGGEGVGMTSFLDLYKGDLEEVELGKKSYPVVVLGGLTDQNLPDAISEFVHQVHDIKEKLKNGKKAPKDSAENIKTTFNPEFYGMKGYQGKREVRYESHHGLVVNKLEEELRSLGYQTGSDRNRDVYIHDGKNKINVLFEIKTSITSQSIYSAIGQLMIYSLGMSPAPKRYFVVPEALDKKLEKHLKTLGINTLIFSKKGKRISFSNLKKIGT